MNLTLIPTWQPGQAITTPTTRLSWVCLADWCDTWLQLHHRAASSAKDAQQRRHVDALPLAMIMAETDTAVLDDFLFWLPQIINVPRGKRADHPTTRLIQAASNRRTQLERSCLLMIV